MKKSLLLLGLLLFILATTSSTLQADNHVYGIDISHHQGDINWERVRYWEGKKIEFVYIKATEGATLQDTKYKRNTEGAKSSNLLVGSYHYFKSATSPINQFKNFSSVVEKSAQDLVPIVDVEELKGCTEATFHINLKYFLKLMQSHFQKKPLIYTSNSFYNRYLAHRYDGYKFFIGKYSPQSPVLRDNRDWAIWQFTEKASIAGINQKVDVNRISVKYDLENFLLRN